MQLEVVTLIVGQCSLGFWHKSINTGHVNSKFCMVYQG